MIIRWLSLASSDLEKAYEYVLKNNPEAAESEIDRVLDAAESLKEHPEIGRPGRVTETRELIVGNYIVAYRVKDMAIQILRVLHAKRLWPKEM